MSAKVAVIGAGWCGIGVLRTLLEKGHQVDLYEKNDDVGGTWHPSNCYADLRLHDLARQVAYFDYSLPDHIDITERIPSEVIFLYLQNYCKAKKLYEHMIFNSRVLKINYDSKRNKSKIYIQKGDGQVIEREYDYIVYTNGYSCRNIPKLSGADQFSGEIVHSFDVSSAQLSSYVRQNKKITILGASKTATDFALSLHKYGYQFSWLSRAPYWFIRLDPLRQFLKDKKSGRFPNLWYKMGVTLSFFAAQIIPVPSIVMCFFRFFNLIHTYGEKHFDFRKFHLGYIDENQMRDLKRLYSEFGVLGDISLLQEKGICLKSGKFIESDVIICCTGSGAKNPDADVEFQVDGQRFCTSEVKQVYNSKVIPQLPNLIFTAYQSFALGTINGLIQGNWIAKYIELHPSQDYLEKYAITFDHSFFLHPVLFDSSDTLFHKSHALASPYFKSNELSKWSYYKWILKQYFAVHPSLPLDFHLPDRSYKMD